MDADAIQMVESMPIELLGERMHASCMTSEEQQMTVFFLNRDRMAGRLCSRCGEPFESIPVLNQKSEAPDA